MTDKTSEERIKGKAQKRLERQKSIFGAKTKSEILYERIESLNKLANFTYPDVTVRQAETAIEALEIIEELEAENKQLKEDNEKFKIYITEEWGNEVENQSNKAVDEKKVSEKLPEVGKRYKSIRDPENEFEIEIERVENNRVYPKSFSSISLNIFWEYYKKIEEQPDQE